jgi:hypothetical protein
MSELFAFRTATVVAPSFSAETTGVYDPETQTSTWESGTALLAVHCTSRPHTACWVGAGKNCNAYGSYCTTYGGFGYITCD